VEFNSRPTGVDVGEPETAFFVNFEGSKMKLVQFFNNFAREEDGVTAIEYGLIAALIAIVIIGAVTVVGTSLCGTFDTIAGALGGATGSC
jgi:pilus assembly protein Flp/PilA